MTSLTTSKAAFKAKNLGLKVNTDLPPIEVWPSSPPDDKASHMGEIFSQLATAPAVKLSFNIGTNSSKQLTPKVSEAFLSTDWRKDYRPQPPPPTAPAKKVQFSEEEIKPKKLHIDTSATTNYGLRRYRDTPVDPEFIHSAPATKKEFDIVRDEDDDVEDEDDDHIFFQTPQSQAAELNQANLNKLVQLKQIMPIPKEIESAVTGDSGFTTKSPYFMVSPVHNFNGSDIEFPLAEIQEVKNGKRFRTRPWDDIETAVKQRLSELEAPRTAGLPVDMLRREYKQRQAQAEAERQKVDETIRFNALLEKLQKSRKETAARGNTRRPSIIDIKPPFWTKNSDETEQSTDEAGRKGTEQRRPSHDSAISGLSIADDNKPSSLNPKLNPKAPEFSISPSEELPPKPTVIVSVEQFLDMCERLKRVEIELALEKAQQPYLFPSERPQQRNISSGDYTLGPLAPNMVQPLPNNPTAPQDHSSQSTLPQHVKKYLERYPDGNAPSNPAYYLVNEQNPLQINGFQTMPLPPPPVTIQTQQNGVAIRGPNMTLPNIMPPAAFQQAPVYVHNQFAADPNGFNRGALPQGPHTGLPVTAYPLGPKPVRKPRGPTREGDIRQTMHQQQYEAYLEYKRSTDINFAKAAKTRQARRAQRNRAQKA